MGSPSTTRTLPGTHPQRGTEEVTGETYGPLKVACEDDVRTAFGDDAIIVRPGIVAGPYDPTDRFTSWVRRAARGGRVIVPPRLDQPVQVVDGRDLGAFCMTLLEDEAVGTFDAVGPEPHTTLSELLDACAHAAGVTVDPVAVPAAALAAKDLPGLALVLPEDGSADGLFQRRPDRGRAAGLRNRPLSETATDTLAWDRARGLPDFPAQLTETAELGVIGELSPRRPARVGRRDPLQG